MGWATVHIDRLLKGETVKFRPKGNSMTGRVGNGDLCTVEPITDHSTLKKGDVVLCKVGRAQYLHLITAIQPDRFQISNNKGHVNGWCGAKAVYGLLVKVEP